jgi:hypothetical protein
MKAYIMIGATAPLVIKLSNVDVNFSAEIPNSLTPEERAAITQ